MRAASCKTAACRAKRKRSDQTASFLGRPERLAALVAAVAGAVVISRAERRPFRCLRVAAEVEAVIAGAMP